jgi:hypothetical protein
MAKRLANLVISSVDEALHGKGFQREKKVWRKASDDTILVAEATKSRWGGQFDVVLGILVRGLSDNPAPKTHQCHIQESLEMLVRHQAPDSTWEDCQGHKIDEDQIPKPIRDIYGKLDTSIDISELAESDLDWLQDHQPPISRALDLENCKMKSTERRKIIQEALLRLGLPFLEKLDSVAKIRRAIRKGELAGIAVWKVVYDLVGIAYPE